MELLFSRADVRGVAYNADYPHQVSIAEGDTAAFEALCRFDHVGAIYKNNHRSRKNFIRANVLMMDCDNDGSEDPAAWLIPDTITARYPDLIFYAVPSKSHMKEKRNGQTDKYFSPRPRHHYYYPLSCEILSESDLSALKEKFLALFPQFDDGAKDSARFFYGVEDPHATFYPGTKTIDECLLDVPDPEDKKLNLALYKLLHAQKREKMFPRQRREGQLPPSQGTTPPHRLSCDSVIPADQTGEGRRFFVW